MEESLKYELAKRIFGQLGAFPELKDNVGAIIPEAIIPRELTMREDGKEVKYPLYVVQNDRGESLILANIGDRKDPELIMVAENEQVILGFHFWNGIMYGEPNQDASEWERQGTTGDFWTWDSVREQWIPLSMQHILMLTAAFEDITQSGTLWNPHSDWRPMYDWIVQLADFVVEAG